MWESVAQFTASTGVYSRPYSPNEALGRDDSHCPGLLTTPAAWFALGAFSALRAFVAALHPGYIGGVSV